MRNKRYAHLVGSIPFKDEKTAMAKALTYLGGHLKSLPDGEIGKKSDRHKLGERLGWIQWVIERFENNPAFSIIKTPAYESRLGLWADYNSGVRYKLNVSVNNLYQYLDFGYLEYFKASYKLFKNLRKERRNKGLKFQFGIPGALAISLFSLGLIQGIRTRKVFEDRLAYECNRIHEFGGDDILFQIEVPIELGLYLKAPEIIRPLVIRWAAGNIISLVNKMNKNALVGIHLCLGDLNNRPFSKISDLGSMVAFSNELIRQWPQDRALDFVHYPLAMANIPPSTDPEFYSPLKKVDLPAGTRFIAGFIHEGLKDNQQKEILSIIEKNLGRTVDVSSSCGFGRRTPDITETLLKKTSFLVA
jgi:hypothetical protein